MQESLWKHVLFISYNATNRHMSLLIFVIYGYEYTDIVCNIYASVLKIS